MLLKTKLNNVNSRSLIKMLTVCPSLVVTTTVMRSFIMGLTLTVVLLMSEVIVSLFRKLIPLNLRDLVYIMVSAFSASLTEILLNMWLPAAAQSLGVYLRGIYKRAFRHGQTVCAARRRQRINRLSRGAFSHTAKHGGCTAYGSPGRGLCNVYKEQKIKALRGLRGDSVRRVSDGSTCNTFRRTSCR